MWTRGSGSFVDSFLERKVLKYVREDVFSKRRDKRHALLHNRHKAHEAAARTIKRAGARRGSEPPRAARWRRGREEQESERFKGLDAKEQEMENKFQRL